MLAIKVNITSNILADSIVREINLDKVRPWKPFDKFRQQRGLASSLFLNRSSGDQRNKFGKFNGMERVEVGYELYADGPTRVLRISISGSHKGEAVFQSSTKIQLRVSHFAIHLLEHGKQVRPILCYRWCVNYPPSQKKIINQIFFLFFFSTCGHSF